MSRPRAFGAATSVGEGSGVLGAVVDVPGGVAVVGEVGVGVGARAPATEEAGGLYGRPVGLVIEDERAAAGSAAQALTVGDVHAAVVAVGRRPFAPHRVVDARGDADRVRVIAGRPVEADSRTADRALDVHAAVTAGVEHDEGVVTTGTAV